jgi:hypothetical protein
VVDGDNNGYVFTLPKIKYSGGKVVAGAINQDVMLEMPFTALMDGVSRKTIFVDRLYAPDTPRYPPTDVELEIGGDNGMRIWWHAPHCDLVLSNDTYDLTADAVIPPFHLTAPEFTYTDGADEHMLDIDSLSGFMLTAPVAELVAV